MKTRLCDIEWLLSKHHIIKLKDYEYGDDGEMPPPPTSLLKINKHIESSQRRFIGEGGNKNINRRQYLNGEKNENEQDDEEDVDEYGK